MSPKKQAYYFLLPRRSAKQSWNAALATFALLPRSGLRRRWGMQGEKIANWCARHVGVKVAQPMILNCTRVNSVARSSAASGSKQSIWKISNIMTARSCGVRVAWQLHRTGRKTWRQRSSAAHGSANAGACSIQNDALCHLAFMVREDGLVATTVFQRTTRTSWTSSTQDRRGGQRHCKNQKWKDISCTCDARTVPKRREPRGSFLLHRITQFSVTACQLVVCISLFENTILKVFVYFISNNKIQKNINTYI